jgi:hypothetical protein
MSLNRVASSRIAQSNLPGRLETVSQCTNGPYLSSRAAEREILHFSYMEEKISRLGLEMTIKTQPLSEEHTWS